MSQQEHGNNGEYWIDAEGNREKGVRERRLRELHTCMKRRERKGEALSTYDMSDTSDVGGTKMPKVKLVHILAHDICRMNFHT